jgi:hypothetical protein
MRTVEVQSGIILSALFSLYVDRLRMTEQRIAVNVSTSTATFSAKTGRRIPKPRPEQLLGEPIYWVDTSRYLGVILDARLTWSTHIGQVRRKRHRHWK